MPTMYHRSGAQRAFKYRYHAFTRASVGEKSTYTELGEEGMLDEDLEPSLAG